MAFPRKARSGAWLLATMFLACNGNINCSACLPSGVQDLPNGFSEELKLDGAAQFRLTRTGLNLFENKFTELLAVYQAMPCGGPEDLECPARYNSSCDMARGVCVDQVSGDKAPILAFPIERDVSNDAVVCRDELTDPNRRECAAWLRLEGLKLTPKAGGPLEASVRARVHTSPLPIRYNSLGMDCLVTLNSEASGAPEQEFILDVAISEWMTSTGTQTRQLAIEVTNLTAMIDNGDLDIDFDPEHGSNADRLLCAVGNLGPIKSLLVDRLVGELSSTIDEALQEALAQECGGPGDPECPDGASCNSSGFCEDDVSNRMVPQILGLEGRADLSQTLQGAEGNLDLAFVVGGSSIVDTSGLTLYSVGGLDYDNTLNNCTAPLPHPARRPTPSQPMALPTSGKVDLDWDGMNETEYMVAGGVSQPLMDHANWLLYSSGLLCQDLTSDDSSFINTGSLSVLMPSLRQLTHADRILNSDALRFATQPARVVLQPTGEGRMRIGSGRMSGLPNSPMLEEPLIALELDDLKMYFSAMVEERWVHLMTIQADLAIPLGLFVTPSNSLEFMIGDLDNAVTNVSVTDHKLLAETEAELAQAIPSLLSLIVPQLTQSLQVPLTIPPAAALGGFDVEILGIRGIEDGQGAYSHFAFYGDLDFDQSMAPNLSLSAETRVNFVELEIGVSDELSITHASGPLVPVAHFELAPMASNGMQLEYQYRVDSGLWSPFFKAERIELRKPEFLAQGHHSVEFRARIEGEYRTLDATPAVFDLLIDTEAPILSVKRVLDGVKVSAFDVVSRDQLRFELGVNGSWVKIDPAADGFVEVPAFEDPYALIEIAALDEKGLRTQKTIQSGGLRTAEWSASAEGSDSTVSTCRCVSSSVPSGTSWFGLLLCGGLLLWSRQRRSY